LTPIWISCFQAAFARTCPKRVPPRRGPLRDSIRPLRQRSGPSGSDLCELSLASSSSSESPDVTMSERTRCGGHGLLYPDNPDGALEAVKVGWGLGAAVCIWTGRAGSPSNSIRSRPQAGIKSDRGRLHRLGRGRRSSERCSHLLVALGSGVLGACAAPVLRHRRY
jgi:hypothetical protein